MRLHHLRNATCILETGTTRILLDPMLGPPGSLPAFSRFRYAARRNPLVPLPQGAPALLESVTHCLITHSRTMGIRALQHTDHLDGPGEDFLRDRRIPVATVAGDAQYLRACGLHVAEALEPWQPRLFGECEITAIPARHGHGWIHRLMANGAGYHIRPAEGPTIYFSGDTVLTPAVQRALQELQPDVAVVAAGSARLDVGGPILMPLDEVLEVIRIAPKLVVANHLEALNHCPTTREQLREAVQREGLQERVLIPEDGESLDLSGQRRADTTTPEQTA